MLFRSLASLDAPRKAEILYYVERLRDELRIPMVYVSHSLDEVVRLADAVVLMSEGRVLATGPVREMASRIELRPYLGRQEGGAVDGFHRGDVVDVGVEDREKGEVRACPSGGGAKNGVEGGMGGPAAPQSEAGGDEGRGQAGTDGHGVILPVSRCGGRRPRDVRTVVAARAYAASCWQSRAA